MTPPDVTSPDGSILINIRSLKGFNSGTSSAVGSKDKTSLFRNKVVAFTASWHDANDFVFANENVVALIERQFRVRESKLAVNDLKRFEMWNRGSVSTLSPILSVN